MPIKLEKSSKKITLKILNSSNWAADLEKIKAIKGSRYDSATKLWSIDEDQIADILNRMGKLGTPKRS